MRRPNSMWDRLCVFWLDLLGRFRKIGRERRVERERARFWAEVQEGEHEAEAKSDE